MVSQGEWELGEMEKEGMETRSDVWEAEHSNPVPTLPLEILIVLPTLIIQLHSIEYK